MVLSVQREQVRVGRLALPVEFDTAADLRGQLARVAGA
jgi:hypothetical protein